MSILSDFEDRLASVVDGVFAGVFRSPVQPVEIAKALGSIMDDKRSVGVSRVYAPTHYTVSISPADAEEMGAFRDTLSGELATYVVARAQEKQYHLASRPKVGFVVDDRLKLGRFKVDAEMSAPVPQPASPPNLRADLAARIPEVRPKAKSLRPQQRHRLPSPLRRRSRQLSMRPSRLTRTRRMSGQGSAHCQRSRSPASTTTWRSRGTGSLSAG